MKHFARTLALGGAVLALATGLQYLKAQTPNPDTGKSKNDGGNRGKRGNFDPAALQQRMMEGIRERLEVKDDGEWGLIAERITKVMESRLATAGGFGGFRGGPPGGGPGGAPPDGGDNNNRTSRTRTSSATPDPDAEALQKAIEAKAPADEIKAKLAKYRDSRKDNEAKLEKAQDELRAVLTVRQEAQAVLMGLLK